MHFDLVKVDRRFDLAVALAHARTLCLAAPRHPAGLILTACIKPARSDDAARARSPPNGEEFSNLQSRAQDRGAKGRDRCSGVGGVDNCAQVHKSTSRSQLLKITLIHSNVFKAEHRYILSVTSICYYHCPTVCNELITVSL